MRRTIGIVAAVGIAGFLVLGIVPAASASPVSTVVDGMSFSADDGDVAAGATLTQYAPGSLDVVIPDTVTIGADTYAVTAIGNDAFEFDSITSVVFPSGLTSIGFQAFFENSLTSLTIPDSVTTLEPGAFSDNQLTSLSIGSGLTSIPESAFIDNVLTSVTIPSGITSVGDNAFNDDQLTSVVLGSGVTSIGIGAFYFNALTSVTIPASVTSVGLLAFGQNPDLTSVTFDGPAPTTITSTAINPSLGTATGLVVNYYWANGSPQAPGGFTSPTWQGYTTRALVTTTFVLDGHGSGPGPQVIPSGTAVTEPLVPTATLWIFEGWYTDAAFAHPASFTAGLTTDQTLFARWDPALAVTGEPFDYAALWGGTAAAVLGLALLLIARRRKQTNPTV
jgi:uncharacterized repeat protein (TIGR02543 family)